MPHLRLPLLRQLRREVPPHELKLATAWMVEFWSTVRFGLDNKESLLPCPAPRASPILVWNVPCAVTETVVTPIRASPSATLFVEWWCVCPGALWVGGHNGSEFDMLNYVTISLKTPFHKELAPKDRWRRLHDTRNGASLRSKTSG